MSYNPDFKNPSPHFLTNTFINYYPSALLFNKAESHFEVICGCLSPAIGITLLIISVKFFYIGLRHYNGAGS